MPFVTRDALARALSKLHGTADHLLKVWFALKQMGMSARTPVEITTSSPTTALQRLFSYGAPEGEFFIPFAHTRRFATMKSDAARSIIQTTLRRWRDSGSVVT